LAAIANPAEPSISRADCQLPIANWELAVPAARLFSVSAALLFISFADSLPK
jgi:hypothetical protein